MTRRLCLSLAVVSCLAMLNVGIAGQDAATLRFRFAFGALTGTGATQALTAVTEDRTMKTGDRMKLMVRLLTPGFVYVIHRGPKGEIDLLFPPDLKQAAQVGATHYIPEGAGWLTLDENAGDESFYVLGSVQRLADLETHLGRYAGAAPADTAARADAVVAEIRRLRAEHRNVAAAVERPVVIGGNVRSLDPAPGRGLPDVDTIAVEVSAGKFYARTYTVTHR